MGLKRKIIEIVTRNEIKKLLILLLLILIIIDIATTLYAFETGLFREGNIAAYNYMQEYGVFLGLIASIGHNIFLLVISYMFLYILIKKFVPYLLKKSNQWSENDEQDLMLLFEAGQILILFVFSILSFLAIINNLSLLALV